MTKVLAKLFFGLEGKNNNPNLTLLNLKKTIKKYSTSTTKFINNNESHPLLKRKSVDKANQPSSTVKYTPIKQSASTLKNRSDMMLLDIMAHSKQRTLNSSASSPLFSSDQLPSFQSSKPNKYTTFIDGMNTTKNKASINQYSSKLNIKPFNPPQSSVKTPMNNSIGSGFFSKTNVTRPLSFSRDNQRGGMKRCLSSVIITSSMAKERDILAKGDKNGQVPFLRLSKRMIKQIKKNYKKVHQREQEKKLMRRVMKERNSIERLIDYKKNKISFSQSAIIRSENKQKIRALERINDQVCYNHIDFLENKMHLNFGPKAKFVFEERQELNKRLNNDSFVYVDDK